MTTSQHAEQVRRIIANADALAANPERNARTAAEIVSRTSNRMMTARF
jgi:hypothetical protein